jgi:hypothetical protein
MDIKQVMQARANRKTRIQRPFKNFFDLVQQCTAAGDLIVSGAMDPRVTTLIERSAVISTVTAIEVYYRDILDFIFRYCKPAFFEPHLKHLFPEKFDIADLLDIYRHKVHPLELVTAAQSFQNVDRIDRIFSRLLEKGGLWENVFNLQVRVKDEVGTESSFDREELVALKRVFDLRHELVHNPARRSFFTQETLEDLWAAIHMVAGSDIVLTQAIRANRDPALDSEASA